MSARRNKPHDVFAPFAYFAVRASGFPFARVFAYFAYFAVKSWTPQSRKTADVPYPLRMTDGQ